MSSTADKRLLEERKLFRKNRQFGFVAKPATKDDDSSWEGGSYPVTITFPDSYPVEPPVCSFPAGFFHPNVYPTGKILMGIQELLITPNIYSPAQGPIYVCTTNDSLDDVLQRTPPSRRRDLVFFQNGWLLPWLQKHGLADEVTLVALYMAAGPDGTAKDGGRTATSGRWARHVAHTLARGQVSCSVVDSPDMCRALVEKHLWASIFWMLSAALGGAQVGHIVAQHRSDVEALVDELLPLLRESLAASGESTTMALVAERWGLIPELQSFAKAGKPVWGTCAGMIFLAEAAEGQKKGGQALLGGLDITVSRNFFGAQVNSFETRLPAPECVKGFGSTDDFRAVFIRAPAVLSTGPDVEVLAEYTLTPEEAAQHGREKVIVGVRKGVLMATAFHPELTTDIRWHQAFVDMVRKHSQTPDKQPPPQYQNLGRLPNRPPDLPVYGKDFMRPEEQ
ncbi:hypothetical protein GPECTOR_1g636 [Gonium pectorale]|uniref:UBC core domain-containing protein n=1 Tax=Gonium pectorale TaxID=33097 RepID=A0A150H3G4_GONPE|nr:hypothetical protein GPECTOR_1g636 [Gonium pectorale]|eukprot:KXZ56706.1 hypothetical protein GPECTOR_1g636 [Gonium pectorale]